MTASETFLEIVSGDHPFLIDDYIHRCKSTRTDFESHSLDGSIPIEDIIQEIQHVSMFQSKRWFIQNNPKWLLSSGSAPPVDAVDRLIGALQNGQDMFTIVASKALDKRKKTVKSLLKHAHNVRLNGFKDWEMDGCRNWLVDRAQAMSIPIDSSAVDMLMTTYGIQVEKLAQALSIAHVYSLNRTQSITREDIQALFPEADSSIFIMTDALKKGDYGACFHAASQLLHQKLDPIYLMAIIQSQLRLFAALVFSKSASIDSLAKSLGRSPYFLKHIQRDIGPHMRPKKLKAAYLAAHKTDLAIKSGVMKPEPAALSFFSSLISD